MKRHLAIAAFVVALGTAAMPMAARAEFVADAIKAAQQKEDADDDEGAWDIYTAIIRQYPKEFPEVYVYRADLEGRHGDEKEEIADYTKALALDQASKDPILKQREIYEELGEATHDIDDEKGAIAAFTAALKSDPKDQFLVSKRGEARFYLGDCTGAAADYSQAIALASKPEFLDYVGRGMAHICLGDLANATDDYRNATALTEKEISEGQTRGLTEWDLTAWAVTAHFAGREEADKVLSRRLSETKTPDEPDTDPDEPDTDYDAARAFLGQADLSVIASDVAAIKAKNNEKSDIWDSQTYYDGGLKEMIDGHDAAATADFQKVLGLHSVFIDLRPLSRAWIGEIRRGKRKD